MRDEPDGLRGASLHIARPSTGRDVVVYAGNAERVLAREDVRALLASVSVRPGATLYDEAREFARVGRRLRVLESRKAAVSL